MRAKLSRLSDHRRRSRAARPTRRELRGSPRERPAESPAAGPSAAPAAQSPDTDPAHTQVTPERRAREGGGPEDRAYYSCPCGYAFSAQVSTSVHCPHCGDTQAW